MYPQMFSGATKPIRRAGESKRLNRHFLSNVDLILLRKSSKDGVGNVLIVGGWPGITAICLRAAGHRVTALEHPSVVSDAMVKMFAAVDVRLLSLAP